MVGHKKEEFVLGVEEGEKYVEVICIIMEERKEEKGTYIMGEERERGVRWFTLTGKEDEKNEEAYTRKEGKKKEFFYGE